MEDRRGDWEHGVDENLAGLNAGQRVWERELVANRKVLSQIDRLIRGDPDKDTDGLIARFHSLENELNLLKAIVLKDAAGNKGLVGRVESLEGGERRLMYHWQFWIALLGLLGTLSALAFKYVPVYFERPNVTDKKHAKTKSRVHRIAISVPSEADDE